MTHFKHKYQIELDQEFVETFEEIKKHEGLKTDVATFKFLITLGSNHTLGRMLHDTEEKK